MKFVCVRDREREREEEGRGKKRRPPKQWDNVDNRNKRATMH
jgi:hypothetical protein